MDEGPAMMGIDLVVCSGPEETCCSVSGEAKESVGDDPPVYALLIGG